MAEPEIVTPPNLPLRDGDVLDRALVELIGTDKADGDRTVRIPLSVLGADADRNRRTLKVVSASSYTLESIDATKVVVLTGFGSVAVTVTDAIMETLNEGEFIIVTGDETTAVVTGSGVNVWTIQGASAVIRNWGVGRLRQIYVGEVGGDFINGLYLYGDIERPDLVDIGSQQDIIGSKRFFGTSATTPFRFTRHGTDSTACAIRLVKERGTKVSPTDAALADTAGSVQAAVRRQIPSAPASAEHQVGNFRFLFVGETASGVEGRWELVLNKGGSANVVISAFADGSSIIRGAAANIQLDATGSGAVPGLDFTKNDGVDGYRVEYDDTGGMSFYDRSSFETLLRLSSGLARAPALFAPGATATPFEMVPFSGTSSGAGAATIAHGLSSGARIVSVIGRAFNGSSYVNVPQTLSWDNTNISLTGLPASRPYVVWAFVVP